MTLAGVSRFVVAESIVLETQRALREAGADGYELFVLWSGTIEAGSFTALTPHVPVQQSFKLESGLCVRVEGAALHELNAWLYVHREILGVQVHAHPTEAYHSRTDDSFPVVTVIGGLSIVVPDFARRGVFGDGHAIYRLDQTGWTHQPDDLIEVA